MRRIIQCVGLSLSLLSTLHALAQTPPDAGALQQQIERERALQLPQRIAPEKPARPPEMQAVPGVTITVTRFRFEGNTLLSDAQLQPAIVEYLSRPLDFNQLQAAALAVANLYREAGWVVRAYLPEQEIDGGVVTIQIVEAAFGGTHIDGESKRVAPELIRRHVEAQQREGEPLNLDALDRAMLLANDLPGVAVSGGLRSGASEGETDLTLVVADDPLIGGEVMIDNTGSRSTGSTRLAANLHLASPFGLGEGFSAGVIHAEGNDYARLAFSLPVGAHGLRVGANVSQLRYKLVGSDFSGLGAQGDSRSGGLELSYPIVRSRLRNLYLTLNADRKAFDNEFAGATTTRYTINSYSLGLTGNLFDNISGGGANSASLIAVSGRRENRIGTTDQQFTKLRYSLSRQQVITEDLSLLVALAGQRASKDLDSSERFYLGGVYGVRAYPSSEGGGSSAHLANLEWRWRLPKGFVLSGFYDHGRVGNRDGSPSYSLKGVGAALAWHASFGLNLKATWARRIGDNPNPAANGKDQDGSLIKNRWWLTASLPF